MERGLMCRELRRQGCRKGWRGLVDAFGTDTDGVAELDWVLSAGIVELRCHRWIDGTSCSTHSHAPGTPKLVIDQLRHSFPV